MEQPFDRLIVELIDEGVVTVVSKKGRNLYIPMEPSRHMGAFDAADRHGVMADAS